MMGLVANSKVHAESSVLPRPCEPVPSSEYVHVPWGQTSSEQEWDHLGEQLLFWNAAGLLP